MPYTSQTDFGTLASFDTFREAQLAAKGWSRYNPGRRAVVRLDGAIVYVAFQSPAAPSFVTIGDKGLSTIV